MDSPTSSTQNHTESMQQQRYQLEANASASADIIKT
jgi:hypothetical protein